MISVMVDKKELNNWIEYIDIDEAIKEAIKANSRYIKVDVNIYGGYSEKYDEVLTRDYCIEEIDIVEDLGITVEDIIEYCYYNCQRD